MSEQEREERALTVALALLTRQLHDSAAAAIANMGRAAEQEQAKPPPETYGFADAKDRVEAGETYDVKPVDAAPKPPPSPAEKVLPTEDRPQSAVPAFDRPQPVIVMGPKPLPVEVVKGPDGTSGPRPPARAAGPAAPGGIDLLNSVLTRRFAAIFAPLASLDTVLRQANSGLGVFQKSVDILGATLAPFLLPIFVQLGAGVLTVADYLHTKLLPALQAWFRIAQKAPDFAPNITPEAGDRSREKLTEDAQQGIGAVLSSRNFWSKITQSVSPLGSGLLIREAVRGVGGRSSEPGEAGSGVLTPESQEEDRAARVRPEQRPPGWLAMSPDAQRAWARENPQAVAPAGKQGGGGGGNLPFQDNQKLLLQSLLRQIGPQANYQGLADVRRSAQLDALNADPLGVKMQQRLLESINDYLKVISEKTGRGDEAPAQYSRGN